MITNERQYKITRAQADKFREALDDNNELELIRSGVDPIIAAAHKQGIKIQLNELESALAEYDELRAGERSELVAGRFWEIGERLIQARIIRGLTQRELADRLHLKEQQVQRYEQERYRTANLERLSAIADALSINVHIALQVSSRQQPEPGKTRSFDPVKLPVRVINVMKRRGWLDEYARDVDNVPSGDNERAAYFISEYQGASGLTALHRMNVRAGSTLDDYALIAWKARVIQKARRLLTPSTTYEPLNASFVREVVEMSQQPDGIVRAVQALRAHGALVVFEPHLSGTHLDGAAMLMDGSIPVIGMTLRHDRLDNFWFTLLHEVGHVILHRHKGLQEGFFDDSSSPSDNILEEEADEFAENALIPTEAWKSSFVRFTKSVREVQQFARRFKIGDSIVAGRIRRERGYNLFNELVGNGCVKSLLANADLME